MSSVAPRRSARLAEKADDPQKYITLSELWKDIKASIIPRRSKHIAESEPESESESEPEPEPEPDDNEYEGPVQLISAIETNRKGEATGYALYRYNGMFSIICVDHWPSFNALEVLEEYEKNDFDTPLEYVITQAVNKAHPHLDDIPTHDPHLLALYDSILKHKDQLLTWLPDSSHKKSKQFPSRWLTWMDQIKVEKYHYKHRR